MDNQGFLLPEYVLKIIIALLGIMLLIYLAVSLYSSFFATTDLEKATATLEHINNFEKPTAKAKGEARFPLVSPKNWYLFTFVDDGEWCGGSCLCICPNQDDEIKKNKKVCETQGACKEMRISGAEGGIKLGGKFNFILNYNKEKGAFTISSEKNE